MKRELKVYLPFTLGIMGFLLVYSLFSNSKVDLPKKIGEVDTVKFVFKDQNSFTKHELKKTLNKLNVKHPNIVYAQAKLETGNFKSKYFLKHNNLFGFRTKKGYKKYNNWLESVEDYARWQNKYYKNGDYYSFLLSINYAEDSSYINKLKACLN